MFTLANPGPKAAPKRRLGPERPHFAFKHRTQGPLSSVPLCQVRVTVMAIISLTESGLGLKLKKYPKLPPETTVTKPERANSSCAQDHSCQSHIKRQVETPLNPRWTLHAHGLSSSLFSWHRACAPGPSRPQHGGTTLHVSLPWNVHTHIPIPRTI